jgi:hypothetical protein
MTQLVVELMRVARDPNGSPSLHHVFAAMIGQTKRLNLEPLYPWLVSLPATLSDGLPFSIVIATLRRSDSPLFIATLVSSQECDMRFALDETELPGHHRA